MFSLCSLLELGFLIIMCPAAEKGARLHFWAQHLAMNISFFLSGLIIMLFKMKASVQTPLPNALREKSA